MQMSERNDSNLAAEISAAVESGELYLPPLPELSNRLRAMLERDDCDFKEVAELIHNEPSIVASLLRMANSAAFGGLQQISDLTRAISRLGTERVGSLVVAILHKGHFENDDPRRLSLLKKLWDHAVATALAARKLSLSGGADGEQAFLAGLLHDTGKLLVLKGVDLFEQGSDYGHLSMGLIDELIETLHTELGHRTLESWNLSDTLCRIALRHHDKPDSDDPLLVRVQAANSISKKLGAHPHPRPELSLMEEPAIEALGLRDIELAELMVDLEDEFMEVRRLFT